MELTEAKQKISKLIAEHQHKYPAFYSIRYSNRMTRALASCRTFVKRFAGHETIWKLEFVINEKYLKANLNNWDRIKTTVLHEIAHAICGHQHGHDRVWVSCCKSLGGNGERYAKCGTFNDWN